MSATTEKWEPRRDQDYLAKKSGRISDKKLEQASEEHVARMRIRQRAGQPHAPAIRVTKWCPTRKDHNGERRFYPKTVKVVQLDGAPDVTKKHGKASLKEQVAIAMAQAGYQQLQQAEMMSQDKPALGAGGCDIDPMAF